MSIYMKQKKIKQFLSLMMAFLLVFFLCFNIDGYFTNNKVSLDNVYLCQIPESSTIIFYHSEESNDNNFIDILSMNILRLIPILFLLLSVKSATNSYEYYNWSRLFSKLHQLLIPRYHMSSYKDSYLQD
ncbi:hypothetical protein SAMN05660472_00908 [Natronincola ferrireducens]|uniref:Uncharacterized protein n=1 Tax=Natronincola ferrireducens TaxID=393762 RepID=A0A1G8ZMN0_9FIRM|nr:hypothetical protein SAMN05660472_00908 [Natronincola ferrireducens]